MAEPAVQPLRYPGQGAALRQEDLSGIAELFERAQTAQRSSRFRAHPLVIRDRGSWRRPKRANCSDETFSEQC